MVRARACDGSRRASDGSGAPGARPWRRERSAPRGERQCFSSNDATPHPALIGERVEVCFDIEYDDGNGETYNGLFWFGGEIIKLGGREHGGGQKGTIVIKFDDGTTDSLLANRPTLWPNVGGVASGRVVLRETQR